MSNEIKPKYSLRKAINAMCKDCVYGFKPGMGTWRQQTEACDITKCPLHPVRPVSKSRKTPWNCNAQKEAS
jgi:hypothetical protein